MDQVQWYSVNIKEPSLAVIPNLDSSSFLTDYTNQVYFANGALCDIKSAAVQEGEGVLLHLEQPCVDVAHFQGEFTMYCTSPLWIEAVSKGRPILKTSTISISQFGVENRWAVNSESKDPYSPTGNVWDDRGESTPCRIIYMALLCAIQIGLFYINLAICTAIGSSASKWAYIFAYLFTANVVYCILCAGVIPLCLALACKRSARIVAIVGTILMFVFSCSFGAPLAWFEGHQRALANYLEPSKFKSLNCWRNPTETFDQVAQHFIAFEEPDWYVDYRTRDTQKVSIILEEDDEGNAKSGRYNFCVAPMRYRGSPYCPQEFYAACFRKTEVYGLLSCSDADAATCGWQYNSAGNILRTMNRNEEFFSDVTEEDESKWRAAFNLAPVLFSNPSSSILGFYSGAGPTEIEELAQEKADMRNKVFISGMVVYSFLVLILAAITGFFFGEH